jgi:hypothetical protein
MESMDLAPKSIFLVTSNLMFVGGVWVKKIGSRADFGGFGALVDVPNSP